MNFLYLALVSKVFVRMQSMLHETWTLRNYITNILPNALAFAVTANAILGLRTVFNLTVEGHHYDVSKNECFSTTICFIAVLGSAFRIFAL